jgi:hydroxymethylpyrimidine/phosphomethylpyrimidine kinase
VLLVRLFPRSAVPVLPSEVDVVDGSYTDVFYDGFDLRELTADRLDTKNTHGTGCGWAVAGVVVLSEPR